MKMRFFPFLLFGLLLYGAPASSQDEGTIVKKERVSKGKSFYLIGGPSFRFGGNKSDYSGGLNLEAGYLVRLNRILTIGPSISFTKFSYDPAISDRFANPNAEGNNIYQQDDGPGLGYEVYVVHMKGGDLGFLTAGFNVKVDFIPSSEERRFNVYGIVKPYMLFLSRSEVTANVDLWYANNTDPLDDPKNWSGGGSFDYLTSSTAGLEDWAATSQFSAGMNLGVGAEYSLPSGFSLFVQGTLGMTLPVTYINTSEFPPYKMSGYYHPDYPFVKKGFTSMNISLGAAYRF